MAVTKFRAALALAAASGLAAAAPPAATESGKAGDFASRCAAMTAADFGENVEIGEARYVDAGPAPAGPPGAPPMVLPAHCLVSGTIDRRLGAGGTEYGIGFQIALPQDWSGRFLLQGGGGLNGSIPPPVGPVAAGDTPALARGFAVIAHDSGHKGAVFDDSFMKDQRAALDFAQASVPAVAMLGKAITARFYGKAAGHSYMTGCSTGGREGMLAMERYPELFDGIVVGAPAMRTGDSNLGIEYSQVMFNRAAPRDAEGQPIVDRIFSDADRQTILGGLLDQCDALDGLEDGMIMNVAACHFRPEALQCTGAKRDGCLSAPQVEAMQLAFAGPKDAAGYPVYAPVPYDTGIVFTGPGLPGYLPTGAPGVFGPAPRALDIDIAARTHALGYDAAQRLTDTHVWTNLSTFLGQGSKVLFFHGVSDPWFSAYATWDYWQRAAEANGTAFTDASRFYMVPGMLHCGGGNAFDRFDLLTPLTRWVERGDAPGTVVAGRADSPAQRPLCAHPAYPHYLGGDASKPESFSCRMPEDAES